jgi:hypothetical protein
MGQSLSLSAKYTISLKPSLFTYDSKQECDTPVDITDDHVEKISTFVSSNQFKTDIDTITDVSLHEGSDIVHLRYEHSNIKYNADNQTVEIVGKWKHAAKQAQNKKSVKKPKKRPHTGGGDGNEDADAGKSMVGGSVSGVDDDIDISISDIVDKIRYNMSCDAYLETELSKQAHLYICFTDSVDITKV